MLKTKKEISEMYSFVKLMSIIYKEMGADLFNNLQMAIDQIGVEESEEYVELFEKYKFQVELNKDLNEVIKELKQNVTKKTQ
jgi:hypothetical protein